MKARTPLFGIACACLTSFTMSLSAYAANGTWTGGGNNTNWSNATNWQNSTPADGVDAIANINNPTIPGGSYFFNTYSPIYLDAPVTVGGVSFTGYNTKLEGGPLTLASSAGTPTLSVAGSTSYQTGRARLVTEIRGTQGLVKNGSGYLWLNQDNTYSGETVIESGSLDVWAPNALGLGGAGNGTSVNAGAALILSASVNDESLTIAGTGSGNGAVTGGSSFVWGGDVTLASDAKIGAAISGSVMLNGNNLTLGDSAISGGISGVGNLLVSGDAFLSGNNSYTGTTTVQQNGELTLAGPSAFYGGDASLWTKEKMTVQSGGLLALRVGGAGDFTTAQANNVLNELSTNINQNGLKQGAYFGIDTTNATGNVTFGHVIGDTTGAGGGSIGFAKLGQGTFVVDQAHTYSGDTLIDRGALAISGNGTLGNGSGSLWMESGSLDLGGTTQNIGNVIRSSNSFFADSWSEITIENGTLNANGVYDFNGANVSANLTGSANLFGSSSTLSGSNTFTGNTYANGLRLESIGALYDGDLSKWTSEKISVGTLTVANVSASQASQIYDQLRYSSSSMGLASGSSIGFELTGGNQTWDRAIRDAYGDTAGRNWLTVLYANPSEANGSQLTLSQTGTFSGFAYFDTNLKFGADNATGTGVLSATRDVDLNGHDATVRGLNGWVSNYGSAESTLTFYVDSNDPYYNPSAYVGVGSFQGVMGAYHYNYDEYGNIISENGGINIRKTGNGNAFYSGYLNSGVKSIDVVAGTLVLSEYVSTTSHNYGWNENYDHVSYIGSPAVIRNDAGMLVHGELGFKVVVESGGLLGGNGEIGHGFYIPYIDEIVTVQSGGTLAPGASIGSLETFGSVSFANNSTYEYEVDSSALLSAGADLLVVNGDLNMTLTQLAFSDLSQAPQAFGIGTIFSLMNYTGTWNGGLFALGGNVLDEGEEFYAGQNYWRINYDATSGGLNFTSDHLTGNTSRFINLTATAVPEPSVAMLAATAGLFLLRRRRAAGHSHGCS